MRMGWCDCTPKDYDRIRRNWWMYLLPGRRLVRCRKCGEHLLVRIDS